MVLLCYFLNYFLRPNNWKSSHGAQKALVKVKAIALVFEFLHEVSIAAGRRR